MRIDIEELQLYTKMPHRNFEDFIANAHQDNIDYYIRTGDEDGWFRRSSPFYIFDIAYSHNTGLYEVWYDYIKRRTDRGSSIYDLGAGIGTAEVILLKRCPSALVVDEDNLACLDFIYWRLDRRGGEISAPLKHYDYVVSIDTIQRLQPEFIKPVLKRLLSIADRCFIYINEDTRHPMFNAVPFNLENFIANNSLRYDKFHNLWDVVINE